MLLPWGKCSSDPPPLPQVGHREWPQVGQGGEKGGCACCWWTLRCEAPPDGATARAWALGKVVGYLICCCCARVSSGVCSPSVTFKRVRPLSSVVACCSGCCCCCCCLCCSFCSVSWLRQSESHGSFPIALPVPPTLNAAATASQSPSTTIPCTSDTSKKEMQFSRLMHPDHF